MSVVTYLLNFIRLKNKQLQVHVWFMFQYYNMCFVVKHLGIMAVSQPFLMCVTSRSCVYFSRAIKDNL
jgi:hypothetical protein